MRENAVRQDTAYRFTRMILWLLKFFFWEVEKFLHSKRIFVILQFFF